MDFSYVFIALIFMINGQSTLPNFILIIADDLGFNDAGYKQSTNSYTPTIDDLRNNDAYELTRFYTYPKCAPSRTSLFTGRYAHNNGMQDDGSGWLTCSIFEPPSKQNTFFTEKLKSCHSYSNYFIGKWHMGHYKWTDTATFRGFDYFKGFYTHSIDYTTFTSVQGDFYDWSENTDLSYLTSDTYATTVFGEKAVEIIQNIADSTNQQYTAPFTMTVSFNAPHSPLHWAPQPWRLQAINNGIYGTGSGTGKRKKYNSMIRAMDSQIEDIIFALKDNEINGVDIWDNTYLLFFSDNGGVINHASNYPLRGAKDTNFEGGIRTPMLITGGLLPTSKKGESYDKIIHITDIYATIMDLVSLTTNDVDLDGESFAEILDPIIQTPNTRDTLIINVDNTACSGNDGNGNTICGGIIKDYGNDGVFKLVVGNGVVGTTKKYNWNPLSNQNQLPSSNTNCDPNNKGHGNIPPTLDFNTDCANNNNPCLFKLDDDPCEYIDESQNTLYATKKQELLSALLVEYNNQVLAISQRPECSDATIQNIKNYISSLNLVGWQPYAEGIPTVNTAFTEANSFPYIDVCP